MSYQTIEIEHRDGIASLWLNRPEVRNAMNDQMIAELHQAIGELSEDPAVRVILLAGRGKAFCAGGDLNWMKRAREMTPEQARADSIVLAEAMARLYESPKPTVARVHGSAFAGSLGLLTACDIAIASDETRFCLSEVKLGLIPAMISPFVIKAMGERAARRYMLTAEVFGAAEAHRLGLVSETCPAEALDARVGHVLDDLLAASPQALDACKQLIRDVSGQPVSPALAADTATRIAAVRASDDAQEGIGAFFEKRRPSWAPSR